MKPKSNTFTGSNLSIHIITTWHTHGTQMSFKPVKFCENPSSVPDTVLQADRVYLAQPHPGSDISVEQFCHFFFFTWHPKFHYWLPVSSPVISFSQCTNQSLLWSLPVKSTPLSNQREFSPRRGQSIYKAILLIWCSFWMYVSWVTGMSPESLHNYLTFPNQSVGSSRARTIFSAF